MKMFNKYKEQQVFLAILRIVENAFLYDVKTKNYKKYINKKLEARHKKTL